MPPDGDRSRRHSSAMADEPEQSGSSSRTIWRVFEDEDDQRGTAGIGTAQNVKEPVDMAGGRLDKRPEHPVRDMAPSREPAEERCGATIPYGPDRRLAGTYAGTERCGGHCRGRSEEEECAWSTSSLEPAPPPPLPSRTGTPEGAGRAPPRRHEAAPGRSVEPPCAAPRLLSAQAEPHNGQQRLPALPHRGATGRRCGSLRSRQRQRI